MSFFSTLRQLRVDGATLRGDLIAAIIMAIVAIPNALGGSALAGVNPIHGLYSVIVGTPVAAAFTGSVLMNVDATSATALMTREALGSIDPGLHVSALIMMVVLVGLFQAIFGLLKLGSLVRFISNAVMTGFLTGIAALTILGQVGDLTGYSSSFPNRIARLVDTIFNFQLIDVPTLVLGLGTIGVILLLNRTRYARFSFPIALLLALAAARLLNLDSVILVGDESEIPRALPRPIMPDWSLIPQVLAPALAIAITAVVQASGVSQSFPNPDGRYPDASRDFLGQGIGNLATGFVSGLPIGGSLSGTQVVASVGGRSRWANILTGLFVAIFMLVLAPFIGLLPNTALAAMLIVVGFQMINLPRVRMAWRTSPASLAIMALTFAATLMLPIQQAVFLGVGVHILVELFQSSKNVRLMRITPLEDGGLAEAEVPAELRDGEIVILQPVGDMSFAGAAEMERRLPEVGKAQRAVVILRLRPYDAVGSTLLRALDRYQARLRANDGLLLLAGVSPRVMDQLAGTGLIEVIGQDHIFAAAPRLGDSLLAAMQRARQWVDESVEA